MSAHRLFGANALKKANLHGEQLVGTAFVVRLQRCVAAAHGAHAIPHLLRMKALEESVRVEGDAVEEGGLVHQTRSFFASSAFASAFPSSHVAVTV